MNFAETLRGLWRRWYIVVPGLILSCALAIGAWVLVSPEYHRSATQLLLPSAGSYAPNTGNPFLNLGGLSQAADVLVDALNADGVAGEIMEEHPGAVVLVSRDWANSGPSVLYTVTAADDVVAGDVLRLVVDQTEVVLDQLQDEESIEPQFRITTIPVRFDESGTPDQKKRLTAVAGVGVGFIVLTILLAAVVDGLSRRYARRGSASFDSSDARRDKASSDKDSLDEASLDEDSLDDDSLDEDSLDEGPLDELLRGRTSRDTAPLDISSVDK